MQRLSLLIVILVILNLPFLHVSSHFLLSLNALRFVRVQPLSAKYLNHSEKLIIKSLYQTLYGRHYILVDINWFQTRFQYNMEICVSFNSLWEVELHD